MRTDDYLLYTATEISKFKQTRDAYKKQYWIRSKFISGQKRKIIQKTFKKVDRIRNHLKLWLTHMAKNRPSNQDSYIKLIERGRKEIQDSFKQLDRALYGA